MAIASNPGPSTRPTLERRLKLPLGQRTLIMGLVLATILILAFASGIVWFTLHHAASTGSITEFPLPTTNSGPNGITAGPDGNLRFTELYSNKIGRITTGK